MMAVSPFRLALIVLALAVVVPAAGIAQGSDSVFLRAQRMVTEGQGEAGRALVQRELDAAPMASPRYVQALFWRASLAATAADAERDYRKIIIEYPLSPHAGDALLRMGQLEMARGERDQAVEHFRRLVLEHPTHPQRARASYWSAQLHFQAGAISRACATLADAQQALAGGDVELRNQIEYFAPRCAGPAGDAGSGIGDSVTAPVAAPPTVSAAVTPATPPPTPAGPTPAGAAPAPPAARDTSAFTVQVAAFRTRASADGLRGQLAARGFPVRMVQLGGLWHVRVGQYATRQAAEAARDRMRAGNVRGFVAEMEPR
jgi:cell division septation protein DedD